MAQEQGLINPDRKKIQIFDTTLRDGTQGEHISFSAEDKVRIAQKLDDFGVHYIEGGWPGSNPKDLFFFRKVSGMSFRNAKIVAFGSTRHAKNKVEDDPNIRALMDAETQAVSLFGKSWILHVRNALRVDPEENLTMIEDSVRFLKSQGKEVIYDAEHFFDGYKDDACYALNTLKAAEEAGADVIVLCDTNGGTLTPDLAEIIRKVRKVIRQPLGIHAHNDSDLAVANSIIAVDEGCNHVQGTVNGYGERCGNANLCTVIPNLQLKRGHQCVEDEKLKHITALSHYVSELANLQHPTSMPFVGKSAFAHKGGIHVSAVMRDRKTYEHIHPETVGNRQRVLISDLSGRSNVVYKADELSIDLNDHQASIPEIVEKLKDLENRGFQFEAAEGSFELLVKKMIGEWQEHFQLEGWRLLVEKNESGTPRSEASIRLNVDGVPEHTASEGIGPVNALDKALRKALIRFFPEIKDMHLTDYKVRDLNTRDGTSAQVRVLIESSAGDTSWITVGVSENIIEASWQALMDSFSYYLQKNCRREAAAVPDIQKTG
ncbi:citramalate synthase [bacterium]